jgi:hypothetical protein
MSADVNFSLVLKMRTCCSEISVDSQRTASCHFPEYAVEPQPVRSETVSVTGRGCPQSCEMSRLPYFLDNQLTDVGEVVSLTRRPREHE